MCVYFSLAFLGSQGTGVFFFTVFLVLCCTRASQVYQVPRGCCSADWKLQVPTILSTVSSSFGPDQIEV
jgi:hypothetical protein